MRGQGRAYLPEAQKGHRRNVYQLDYTVSGVRYRESSGTDDYGTALGILKQRQEDRRIGRPATTEAPTPTTLEAYVAIYLRKKEGKVAPQSHQAIKMHLARAVAKFGAARQLASIRAKDVREWDAWLAAPPFNLSGGPRRQHLNPSTGDFVRSAKK